MLHLSPSLIHDTLNHNHALIHIFRNIQHHLQDHPPPFAWPDSQKVIHPVLPLGSKNISLDSCSNTLNYNHTILFFRRCEVNYNILMHKQLVSCTKISKRSRNNIMRGKCPLPHHPLSPISNFLMHKQHEKRKNFSSHTFQKLTHHLTTRTAPNLYALYT